jgi:hypothetical protein
MTGRRGKRPFVCSARVEGLVLGLVGIAAAALLGGCATQPETVTMQAPGGPPQQVTVPKSTFTGAASGAQADALAREIVDANNSTMQQFDQVDGRLDRLQATGSKELQTAQQALGQLEQLSNDQGTGQITLFFKTGSTEIDQFQTSASSTSSTISPARAAEGRSSWCRSAARRRRGTRRSTRS